MEYANKTWVKKQGQSSGLIIIIIGIFIACYMVYLAFFRPVPVPAYFNPGIRVGAGVFTKTLFYQDARLGYISDIEFGQLHPHPGLEYCIAGYMGAIYLDENLRAIEFIELLSGDHQIFKGPGDKCRIRNVSEDKYGRFVYNEERYFELDGQDFPFVYKDDYWIVAEGTAQEIKFPLPWFMEVKGTNVFFENNNAPYYAILAKIALQDWPAGYRIVRLKLYIFDSQKQLIYDEVLDDDASMGPALKAISSQDSSGGFLLVGGAGRIWKYTLSSDQANPAKP